jgi:FkbM family methyltransferase
MGVKRWLLHNVRSALGTAQTLNKLQDVDGQLGRFGDAATATREQIARLNWRIDQLEQRLTGLESNTKVQEVVEVANQNPVVVHAKNLPEDDPTPEGATRLIINGDPILLPNDLVKYVIHTKVSAETDPIPKLLAETEHYLWCRKRLGPGDQAFDIGSNIGLFSVMMGNQVKYGVVGVVHAFEASPTVFRDLCRVIRLNDMAANVSVHHAAVADKIGKLAFIDLQTDSVSRESSHLAVVGPEGQNAPGTVEVQAISIDEFANQHRGHVRPRLIKIDVEGAEFLVLEGARQVIGEMHPYLCIEIHPDASGVFDHARLCKYLDGFGYRYTNRDKTYYCE